MIREIRAEEAPKLYDCLAALAGHHNAVSEHFSGLYPIKPHDAVLSDMQQQIKEGGTKVAVVEENGSIVGFAKLELIARCGYLTYLVVLEPYRGKGYGSMLMDWVMETFRAADIHAIELKVVAGNEAIHLYEKYGFRLSSHIMRYDAAMPAKG